MTRIDLSRTSNREYLPGKSIPVRVLWILIEALTLLNPIFLSSNWKCNVLRLFGAEMGEGVVIKPGIHVKHPWRLKVGDNCWLGERVWIDNLVEVRIGNNVCISQGAYLCTGNHDWSDPGMGMTSSPITLMDGSWIGAFAKIGPGVTVQEDAIVTMGSVLLADAKPSGIYQGQPAVHIRERVVRSYFGPQADE